jgi:two-component system chemotaxis response regulator CheB
MLRPSVFLIEASTHTRRVLGENIGAIEPGWQVLSFPLVNKAIREWPSPGPFLVLVDADGIFSSAEIDEVAQKAATSPSGGIYLLSSSENGPSQELNSLALGWIPKPSSGANLAPDWCSRHLKSLMEKRRERSSVTLAPLTPKPESPLLPPMVLVIGVSTGGPSALEKLLPELPAKFPVPVLLVQHIPEGFSNNLALSLSGRCKLRVREAVIGEPVLPGTIWLAPGNRHMEVEGPLQKAKLKVHQGPLENFCRPAVDPLFRSVAQLYGSRVLAVVLTGMGHDGLEGAKAIRKAGGQVWAQDEATSVVWGMPGAIVKGGLAHAVYPIGQFGPALCQAFSCI